MPRVLRPYAERRIALLTQHGKEQVIAPVLEPALGCHVERVDGYDTDRLGTFTGDVPRPGTQIETARRKARVGMDLAGLPLGLASEGTFGPDPVTGMLAWNVEVLLFIDDERGIEVSGVFAGPGRSGHLLAEDWAAAEAFAARNGFPAQHLVVRPDGDGDPRIRKGIADWTALRDAFDWAQARAASGRVFLEYDLRAHASPARRRSIRRAALDLAARLRSPCPACGTPGFATVERVTGLPCAACGAPTREARADIRGCVRCDHRERIERAGVAAADPGRCSWCNP